MIHAASSTGFVTAVSNGANDVDLQLRALNGGSANSNQLVLDSEGGVGIGTSSPSLASGWSRVVHVDGSAGAHVSFTNSTTGSSNTDGLLVGQFGVNSFFINREAGYQAFHTSNTERMRIDAVGAVTKPYQPNFWARRNGDETGFDFNSLTTAVAFNYEEHDANADFNTSNGLFTAPVDGTYYFEAAVYASAVSMSQSWFVVNSARKGGTDWVASAGTNFVQNGTIIKLDANDTVGFHPYNSSTGSGTITASINHTYFKGYLLG